MKRYKKANEGIRAPEKIKETAAGAQKRGYPRWAGAVAAALAVAILGGAAGWNFRRGTSPAADDPEGRGVTGTPGQPGENGSEATKSMANHALALAAYPEMAPYPKDEDFVSSTGEIKDGYDEAWAAWRDSMDALDTDYDFSGVMDGFISRSTAQFLADAGEENRVYSPLNVYMALSMLAETAGENSRAQILELLQADSIEALRERANALWRDNYRDDGVVTSVLANSLWLRDGTTYSQDTLDTLARDYYASSFSGQMGSEEYNQALRDWLNEQTNGLLKEQAQGLKMDAETVLALASTLYFKAAWDAEFDKGRTETDTFHALGGDVDADFMRQTLENTFYWGDNFTAVQLRFQEGGSMWLILPAEGYGVDELLRSGEAMDFLLADKYDTYDENGNVVSEGWTGQKFLTIHLSMPKFDVSSNLDLIGGLKKLGVTDVFDPEVSDFDPLGTSAGDALYVSQAKHAARVKVDEEGCEAAAYTVMMVDCAGLMIPQDEVDFTLDRPFLFAVTGDSGLPLFTGVVNQPNG